MAKNIGLIIILFVSAAIFIFNHFLFNTSAGPSAILTELNDLQKETLSTLNEMTKLLISLATALFGLIGYFALENFKSVGKIESKYRLDFVLAFSLSAISIDFGYIFMEKWVELLSIGIFKPYDSLVILPQKLQLIAFLLSLFFTGRLVYRNLFKTK